MFGHQDDQHHHHDDDNKPMDDVISDDVAAHVVSGDGGHDDNNSNDDGGFNPALPTQDDGHSLSDDAPVVDHKPFGDDMPAADPAPVATTAGDDDLLSLKQQALTSLSPLVDHLEQSPEEKFRTTMMMIQAADNKDLIKVAYEAAQSIPDEKVKAQALLDIVNEINYFTQKNA